MLLWLHWLRFSGSTANFCLSASFSHTHNMIFVEFHDGDVCMCVFAFVRSYFTLWFYFIITIQCIMHIYIYDINEMITPHIVWSFKCFFFSILRLSCCFKSISFSLFFRHQIFHEVDDRESVKVETNKRLTGITTCIFELLKCEWNNYIVSNRVNHSMVNRE